MHSARDLTSDAFSLNVDGQPATLEDVFPGFTAKDRLGIVTSQPGGATGASGLIMAAITRFYDFQRESGRDFFIYPDYFIFHVGGPHGDHNMLDIWPGHKEVVVPENAEEILQAINDRGITRLLVEAGTPSEPEIKRHTRESAESRIVTVLSYSADGRGDGADVTVAGNAPTESYVSAVIEKSPGFSDMTRSSLKATREALLVDGAAVEQYRRIDLDTALGLLAWSPYPPA